ncbi:MAG: hypothetical protein SNJ75_15750 [Gemmataceae bacterium]
MHRLLAALFLLSVVSAALACPFCTQQGKPFTAEATQPTTDLVLFGKVESANEKTDTSEVIVEQFIKDDKRRGKGNRVTVQKYLDPTIIDDKHRILLFCELVNEKIDAYRGVVVKQGSSLPTYLAEAIKTHAKSPVERLKFFFGYLDDPEPEVAMDAYREFANSDYKEFAAMAKDLPPERIIKWLKSPDTQPFRIGLYASMLGHCGKPEHVAVLKELLADPERRGAGSGVDGLLAAQVLLNKSEGWKALQAALRDTKEDFNYRFAALRAVRFFHEFRPEFIPLKDRVEAVCILLAQDDIADMAVEDLRKWKQWDVADRVLALTKTPAYKEVNVIRRSILRYCLQCKGHEGAAAYVAARRKEDPEAVSDAEELLKLEAESPKPLKEEN